MPYTVPDHARPRVRSAWSFTLPRSDWPCSLARPPCGASPRRQLHHPIVGSVGDVDVAGGIHRHTDGAG